MLKIDAASGAVISHTPAPRKRTFEDLETAAKAMREHDERKESLFRQSVEAEKNKEDLFEKKFAEALRKAKDAPAGKPCGSSIWIEDRASIPSQTGRQSSAVRQLRPRRAQSRHPMDL